MATYSTMSSAVSKSHGAISSRLPTLQSKSWCSVMEPRSSFPCSMLQAMQLVSTKYFFLINTAFLTDTFSFVQCSYSVLRRASWRDTTTNGRTRQAIPSCWQSRHFASTTVAAHEASDPTSSRVVGYLHGERLLPCLDTGEKMENGHSTRHAMANSSHFGRRHQRMADTCLHGRSQSLRSRPRCFLDPHGRLAPQNERGSIHLVLVLTGCDRALQNSPVRSIQTPQRDWHSLSA